MREEFRFGSVLRLRSAWASRRGDQGSEISDISDAYNLCVYVKIVQIVKLHDLHDVLAFLVILKFFLACFDYIVLVICRFAPLLYHGCWPARTKQTNSLKNHVVRNDDVDHVLQRDAKCEEVIPQFITLQKNAREL